MNNHATSVRSAPSSTCDSIHAEWQRCMEGFQRTPALQRLARGEFTIEHYKSVLREIFHHARENPQIQTLAGVYLRGRDRKFVGPFIRHALSEVGHDQLAIRDLRALGGDTADVSTENPLPATSALLAFAFYQIQFRNPIGYLGYLFFLEHTATGSGRAYMERLTQLGVPNEAMTFLEEHATVDQQHNLLMRKYIEGLVASEADLDAVIYSLRTTAQLYALMIQSAFDRVDHGAEYGRAHEEMASADRRAGSYTWGPEGNPTADSPQPAATSAIGAPRRVSRVFPRST